MYKVYLDNHLMYCPTIPSLFLEALSLNLELNATNVCEFTILPENPYYNRIVKRKSIITIYDDGYRVFRGLVQDSSRSFFNSLQVTCEGEMAFLRDSIQRPYKKKGTVEEFFTFLIEEHNKQVDESRRFKIGRCSVGSTSDDTVYTDSQYLSTWENLQKKLVDELGGYLWTREAEDGIYIDYLEDFETLNEQEIEFGKNLLDFEEAVKGTEVKTAIIPLGNKLKEEDDGAIERRLDIKSVNNGIDYVYSEEAVKKYGFIFKKMVWNDVTLPEELLRKGKEELQNYINMTQSIEIEAVNLHHVNKDIRSFRLGNYTRVISRMHDIDEVMLTRKLDLDLLDPASGTLSLGDERKAFVDRHVESDHVVGGVIEKVENVEADFVLNKDMVEQKMDELDKLSVSNVEPEDKSKLWCDTSKDPAVFKRWDGESWKIVNDSNEIVNEIYEQVFSAIKQSSEDVKIEVGKDYYLKSDTDKLIGSLKTEYEQTSEGFFMKFNQFQKDLDDVQKGTDTKFQDISKYIRFVDGTILLGQVGNAFELQIKNNRISFLENSVEIAYIVDRKIYITDGEFLNSLKIGNFAFRPRQNGNLSFGKVV